MIVRYGEKSWWEFKWYLHERSDEGTRLLFKLRLGTHNFNEELRRHGARQSKI